MEQNRIKNLLTKYYAGESSLDEEAELRLFFNSTETVGDLEKHRAEFLVTNAFKTLESRVDFKVDLLKQFDASQRDSRSLDSRSFKLRLSGKKQVLSIAASILLLIMAFTLGRITKQVPEVEANQNLDLQTEVRQLKLLTVGLLLEQRSASQRLKGIEMLAAFSKEDQQVAHDLLFKILNEDQNPNVRLASTAVLKQLKYSEETKQLLMNSFLQQESPIIQIELLRLLEKLDVQIKKESLEEMIKAERLDDNVFQLIMEKI